MRRFSRLFLALSATALFAAAGTAQGLNLSVTRSGNKAVITVSGAKAGLPVVLWLGLRKGTTAIYKGSQMIEPLTLGLALPFVPVPMGNADKSGKASLSFPAPPRLPITVYGQALSPTPKIKFGFPPKIVLGWLLSAVAKVL